MTENPLFKLDGEILRALLVGRYTYENLLKCIQVFSPGTPLDNVKGRLDFLIQNSYVNYSEKTSKHSYGITEKGQQMWDMYFANKRSAEEALAHLVGDSTKTMLDALVMQAWLELPERKRTEENEKRLREEISKKMNDEARTDFVDIYAIADRIAKE